MPCEASLLHHGLILLSRLTLVFQKKLSVTGLESLAGWSQIASSVCVQEVCWQRRCQTGQGDVKEE